MHVCFILPIPETSLILVMRFGKEKQVEYPVTMSEDLATKIRRQVEFYFSGLNLNRDKFMREKMSADPDGCMRIIMERYN